MFFIDEFFCVGFGGFVWNVIGGFGIGCFFLVKFGKKFVVDCVFFGIFNGDKCICLVIIEFDVGFDVVNFICEVKFFEDGKYYIVNGEKKWIINGIWCDYFIVVVCIGGFGMNGVFFLFVECDFGGVFICRMDCQGVWFLGMIYIMFEDVKVFVENFIGKENQGFCVIMINFNYECIGIIIQCFCFFCVCYEELVKYVNKRRMFGKKLIEYFVIWFKLVYMVRQIEVLYNWLENVIYQCEKMGDIEVMFCFGGFIVGFKVQVIVMFEFCVCEVLQIFGGLFYFCGGQGGKVERLYCDVRVYVIFGGFEEIMFDFSIR